MIVFFLCAFACNNESKQPADKFVTRTDTVDSIVRTYSDTIPMPVSIPCDSSFYKAKADSLRVELLIAEYRIERVKYYLAIVDRNPSQLKFLRSWIRRAVE